MAKLQDLVEWDYLGSHYSVYVKHFTDDQGKRGMTLIFEDVTNAKVTEMTVPPRSFAAFLKAVNGGTEPYRGLF
ncbi:MAG: hypothetical protein KGJ09_08215 [Candidatus Omnitrophica bacterium]|nr:hypothetical protein [Candidatus Omnitrophota bacterium]MDE2010044.1 hypothetical protein [Candidatus Omnitrophota bacterium]MDE2214721.1 hypothetical protein [Candidatus Omnitrophota bacterium]MDE2231796.1 hypothetical protein [Candidatus Omnitrophota bacterium]